MQMPRPGPEHAQLARLAGTWIGEETMYPSPWSPTEMTRRSRVASEMQVDGFFLVSNYEQLDGDQVTFRGHGVLGWDGPRKKFTMHWFDSMGMDPGAPALGDLDGNRLEFRNESPMGLHRYVYELEADDGYGFAIQVSPDHGTTWNPLMGGRYRRA